MGDRLWELDYAVEQMRVQRHDFMNYFQVIYGYIQINKPDAAMKYIKNVNRTMLILGKIFNLEHPIVALMLQEVVFNLASKQIEIEFNAEIERIDPFKFRIDSKADRDIFKTAWEILINDMDKYELEPKVFIDIDMVDDELHILGSCDEEFIDLIEENIYSEVMIGDSNNIHAVTYKNLFTTGFKYIIKSR